jgi:hypothetical protein
MSGSPDLRGNTVRRQAVARRAGLPQPAGQAFRNPPRRPSAQAFRDSLRLALAGRH